MKETPVASVAVAWFREDEWDELKTICADLQDTYAEWLQSAHDIMTGMGLTENDVDKVILTADELRNWNRVRGRKIKGNERANLAMRIAHERNGTIH